MDSRLGDRIVGPAAIDIPDGACLLLRAHEQYFKSQELQSGVFRFRAEHGCAMSSDWEGYEGRTAHDTRAAAKRDPEKNGVIRLPIRKVRAAPHVVAVTHMPLPENRAHADVVAQAVLCEKGPVPSAALTTLRLELLASCEVVLHVAPPE